MAKQPKGHKAGWHKSGAFTKSECLTGSKSMPMGHMPEATGKMKSSHAVVPNDWGTGQSRINYGEGTLGKGVRTFCDGIPKEAGKAGKE